VRKPQGQRAPLRQLPQPLCFEADLLWRQVRKPKEKRAPLWQLLLPCCAAGEECDHGVCGGSEPICTPSCPLPCSCLDRADGPGTVCVDCSTRSCPQVSSCAECTAAGRVCFGAPGNFNCGDPCRTMCITDGGSCTSGTQCCSGNCSNGICEQNVVNCTCQDGFIYFGLCTTAACGDTTALNQSCNSFCLTGDHGSGVAGECFQGGCGI
jgi:hypothetical protein